MMEQDLRQAESDVPASVDRGTAALFWAQIVGNSGLFVALVLVTRGLGPSGRGTIAFITVAAMLLARIARLGVTEATTIFAAQREHVRPTLLANLLLSVAAGSVLGIGVVCGVLVVVPEARPSGIGDVEVLLIALAALGSAAADAGYAFVLGCRRFRVHALVTAVSGWLYAATIGALWLTVGLTVVSAALAWIALQALKGAILVALSVQAVGISRPQPGLLLESVRFGVRGWLGSLSDALNDRLDQVLTAYLASQATLGVYAVAVNASEMLFYLPAAVATAILPIAARAGRRDRRAEVLRAFRSVGLVTLAAVAVTALLAPLLVPLVFGSAFTASVVALLLLLPGTVGYLAIALFSSALLASGAPGRSSVGPFLSLVATVVLDVLLVPRYGATGAAVAASTGYLGGGLAALLLFRGLAPFPWRTLVPLRADVALVRTVVAPLARIAERAR